jgi:hypothetical protein
MFYNTSGTWYNSSLGGSWMIRPMFGKEADYVSTGKEITAFNNISVYPNPATEELFVRSGATQKMFYKIFDVMGRNISSGEVSAQRINVSSLTNGIYHIVFSDTDFRTVSSQKVIICR